MKQSRPKDPLAPVEAFGEGSDFTSPNELHPNLGAAYERLGGDGSKVGRVIDSSIRYSGDQADPLYAPYTSGDSVQGASERPERSDAEPNGSPAKSWRAFSPVHAEELAARYNRSAAPVFARFAARTSKPRSYEEIVAVRNNAANRQANVQDPPVIGDLPDDPEVLDVMRTAGLIPHSLKSVPVSSTFNRPGEYAEEVPADQPEGFNLHTTSIPRSIRNLNPARSEFRKSSPDSNPRSEQVSKVRAEARFEKEARSVAAEAAPNVPVDTTQRTPDIGPALDPRLAKAWAVEQASVETEARVRTEMHQKFEEAERRHKQELGELMNEFDRWRS
jgi:hypothetical protein